MITPSAMQAWDPKVIFYIGVLVNFIAWGFLLYAIAVRVLYWLLNEKEVFITFDKFGGRVLTEDGREVVYNTLSSVPFIYSKKKIKRMKKEFRYVCKRNEKIAVRDLGFLGVYYASSPMGVGPFIVPVALFLAWWPDW